jgi:outer membrane protein assembly factor BamB
VPARLVARAAAAALATPRGILAAMDLEELVFVGFNSRVAALAKQTGKLVWSWRAPKTGYVTVLYESGVLLVAVNGYMFGLDPATGALRWSNEMKGFGFGVTSLATVTQSATANLLAAAQAETRRRSTKGA